MTTRDRVLQLLTEEKTVSGERLGKVLHITRNSVWKAMNRLRKEGYEIEAATNRGYRLVSAPNLISETEIRKYLTGQHIGREMEIHSSLDSTNLRARTLAASGAPHGFLVAADSQHAGRGRLGRSFYSPPHSGIYISFVLRPACTPEKAALLTSMAAVATARAIEKVSDARVQIKWVNDLYIQGKKVCGILSEAGVDMESGQLSYVVVGIGVNTGKMVFPPEIREIAGSIGNLSGSVPDRNRLIAEIANELEAVYGELETGAFLEESRKRSNVIGREVIVVEGGRKYPAKALDIDSQGKLVVQTREGITHLGFGEVSLKLKRREQK